MCPYVHMDQGDLLTRAPDSPGPGGTGRCELHDGDGASPLGILEWVFVVQAGLQVTVQLRFASSSSPSPSEGLYSGSCQHSQTVQEYTLHLFLASLFSSSSSSCSHSSCSISSSSCFSSCSCHPFSSSYFSSSSLFFLFFS